MVGTGPFVMTKFVDDQYIEGTANPDYFLGKPKLDKIVFQIYADTTAILNALEAGELDATPYEGGGIPLDQVKRFEAMDHLTVLGNMDGGLPTFLLLNLDGPGLRQARGPPGHDVRDRPQDHHGNRPHELRQDLQHHVPCGMGSPRRSGSVPVQS